MDKLDFPGREFQVWMHTVSHGQLLLRSNKTRTFPTRLDILFKAVAALYLPGLGRLASLHIERVPLDSLPENIFPALSAETKFFRLRDLKRISYVAAAAMFVAEDDGDYASPSKFLRHTSFDLDGSLSE